MGDGASFVLSYSSQLCIVSLCSIEGLKFLVVHAVELLIVVSKLYEHIVARAHAILGILP